MPTIPCNFVYYSSCTPNSSKETMLELDPSMPAWDHPEMCAIISIHFLFFKKQQQQQ